MQFNSIEFAAFLVVVLLAYYVTVRTYSGQRLIVVVSSAVFYAFWSYAFLLHLVGMVSLNYGVAHLMERTSSNRAKRGLLAGAIALNLVNLIAFKYLGLLLDTYSGLCQTIGLDWPQFAKPELVLPLAISFYTFHVVSYLVDLYRGTDHAKPASYLDFLFYVMMFPHQIAGPILRGHELFPQLGYKRAEVANLRLGFERILLGLFQKAAIADNLALVVDHGYKHWSALSGPELYVILVAYSFQIFFDFAGYTNMGIGAARMLGYALPENFNTPYIARDISEFWRRWHMTLSRWIRDYIFIPLGGSKGSSLVTGRNLLITMGLAGLWHGGSWTFMVWGLYHGMGLVIHREYAASNVRARLAARLPGVLYAGIAMFITFQFVTLGWVLFRAPDFTIAWGIYTRLFEQLLAPTGWGFDQAFLFKSYGFTATLLYGIAVIVKFSFDRNGALLGTVRRRLLLYSLVGYLLVLLVPLRSDPFIYFQF